MASRQIVSIVSTEREIIIPKSQGIFFNLHLINTLTVSKRYRSIAVKTTAIISSVGNYWNETFILICIFPFSSHTHLHAIGWVGIVLITLLYKFQIINIYDILYMNHHPHSQMAFFLSFANCVYVWQESGLGTISMYLVILQVTWLGPEKTLWVSLMTRGQPNSLSFLLSLSS